MGKFQAGEKARVVDRQSWPEGYKIAGWTGQVVEVRDDPKGYVILLADNTGYRMAFPEKGYHHRPGVHGG